MDQAEFDKLTLNDLERQSYELDSNGKVARRVKSTATSIAYSSVTGSPYDNTALATELNKTTKAPTVSTTEVASQGGLLINIDNAVGDVAYTSSSWIESDKYGIFSTGSGNFSNKFDSSVKRTGRLTLKLSTTDISATSSTSSYGAYSAGSATMQKYLFPVKASTKYVLKLYVKTNNVAASSVFFRTYNFNSGFTAGSFVDSNKLTGTNDWTLLTANVTSSATAAYFGIQMQNSVAGNISDAWFDVNSMTLEEITEPVTNSITSKSPSLVGFTAVGSTDNVDQSQTTANQATQFGMSGADSTNPTKLAQQFVCTKTKFTGFIFRRVVSTGTFTGDVTVGIYADSGTNTPTGTALATYTWTNAQWEAIAAETDYTVSLPCILTTDGTTKYHIVFQSTTSDSSNYPRVKVGSGATSYPSGVALAFSGASTWTPIGLDLYFKTLYYKPSTNFTARQNNDVVSISADSDGFLEGAKIDLENGAYTYKPLTTTTVGTYSFLHHTVAYVTPTTSSAVCYTDSASDLIKTSGNSGVASATFKVKNIGFTSLFVEGTLRYSSVAYSTDGVNFTTLEDRTADSNFYGFTYPLPAGQDVYVKFTSGTSTANCYMGNNAQKRFRIYGTFDTSPFKTLYNFPTNQNLYATYVKTLATATTTATYRATKYGFPAIEFAEGVYTFLKTDTTATGSTVAFSADGTTYTTVADGAGIGLTSTTYPIVYVRSNITANRLYVSSNDYNADSAKDGSLKCNVQYKTLTQGIIYDVQDLENEVQELKKAGSKDYVLVAKSGGDFDTLYEAVTSGAKNIFVKNGVYEETQMITLTNANTRIRGESREGTIIRAQNGKDLVKVYTNGTEITNLTLDTQTNSAQAAYVIGDGKAAGSPDYTIGNRNRLTNCRVLGSATTFAVFAAGASTSAGAQTITNFNNNQLHEGNVIEDNYLYSTWNGDSFSFSLQKNGSISRNKCYGGRIAFYMTRNSNCSDNAVIGSANQGIFIGAPSWDNVISGNSIYMPASAGIKQQNQLEHPVSGMNALRNAVFGNTVEKAGGIGIEINESQNCTFSNNTFDTPNGHGIYMQTSSNNSVCGNVIRNPNESGDGSSAGIFMTSNVTDNTISNNEIYDDRTGTFKMRGGIVDRETSGCHGNVISGNVIRGRNTERSIWITSNRWIVTGNSVEGGNYAGILVNNGSYNNVSSNILRNNTNESNNVYAEIWLQGTSVGNSVYGNTLLSDATNKAANGVNVDGSAASNTWVGFNRIVGNTGSAIANTGTNTTQNALT